MVCGKFTCVCVCNALHRCLHLSQWPRKSFSDADAIMAVLRQTPSWLFCGKCHHVCSVANAIMAVLWQTRHCGCSVVKCHHGCSVANTGRRLAWGLTTHDRTLLQGFTSCSFVGVFAFTSIFAVVSSQPQNSHFQQSASSVFLLGNQDY